VDPVKRGPTAVSRYLHERRTAEARTHPEEGNVVTGNIRRSLSGRERIKDKQKDAVIKALL